MIAHLFSLDQASSQEKGERTREEIPYSPLKKIKDEPIDEDYDKALISSSHSDISRVKEELENGDHEVRFVYFIYSSLHSRTAIFGNEHSSVKSVVRCTL